MTKEDWKEVLISIGPTLIASLSVVFCMMAFIFWVGHVHYPLEQRVTGLEKKWGTCYERKPE